MVVVSSSDTKTPTLLLQEGPNYTWRECLTQNEIRDNCTVQCGVRERKLAKIAQLSI